MFVRRATSRSISAPDRTGSIMKYGPAFPCTPIKAVDPPGGWMVRVRYMKRMEKPTAREMAKGPVPIRCTTATAIVEETRCPPTRFRGCARGDSAAPKRRTADAPKEPIRRGCPDMRATSTMARMAIEPLMEPQRAYLNESG